jgi:NADH-quinone oxidoreductase subunit H
MISYELPMGLALVVPVLLAGSMSVGDIIDAQNDPPILGWFVFRNPMAAAIMAIALLAEVNRAPFDMPEAEQELTAGYHAEYSGMKFAMFYLAEYISMIAVSAIGAAMYFGGYHFIGVESVPLLGSVVYGIKVAILLVVMIWVRGTLPRIRYDRLMAFGWKVMLPLALVAVAWSAVIIELSDQVSTAGYVALLVATWVIFLVVASVWLERVGHKNEPAVRPRVEVASLSGRQGLGVMTLQAFDKVIGIPAALAHLLRGRGGGGESHDRESKD